MKIQFFPTDFKYKIDNNNLITCIYGKTIDNRRICFVDEDYSPYFFVTGEKIHTLVNEIKGIRLEERNNVYFVKRTEIVERILSGKVTKALKVYVNRPKALRKISSQLENRYKVYEADILFEKKYLFDRNIIPFTLHEAEGGEIKARIKADIILKLNNIKNISNETIRAKIMSFDVERLYKTEEKNNPIVMVSFYTNEFKKTITYANIDRENIIKVSGEEELLLKLEEEIEDYKPDILVGYNSDEIFSYINKRARKYNIEFKFGIDYSNISISKKGRANIFGITHIDLIKFIQNILAESLEAEDYDLEYIGYELLGEDREYSSDELSKVMKDKEGLNRYVRDVEYDAKLIYSLMLKVLPNLLEIAKLVNISLFHISRISRFQLVENLIIKKCRELNYICPNKPTIQETTKRKRFTHEGSFVLKPQPDIYKNVAVIDLKSLYPSIILEHNLSPETFNVECRTKEKAPQTDYWFSQDKKGIIPLVTENLLIRKSRIEETMEADNLLRARLYSLKLLANSMYSYIASTGARWYSLECAESITAYGKHYINSFIKYATKKGIKVIYGDSESLFLIAKKEGILDLIKNFNNSKNIEFEFDNVYKAAILVSTKEGEGALKKYALLDFDENLKIKGFEAVKSNTPKFVKEAQKKILKDILANNEEELILYIKKIIDNLDKNIIPKEKLIIQTHLQKPLQEYEYNTPYVSAARMMKAKGYKIRPGSVVKYIITKGPEKINQRVKLSEEISQEEYDADYYINKQLIPALESILKIRGINREDILEQKDQSKLDSFIG